VTDEIQCIHERWTLGDDVEPAVTGNQLKRVLEINAVRIDRHAMPHGGNACNRILDLVFLVEQVFFP
jgi:hypothetical protein